MHSYNHYYSYSYSYSYYCYHHQHHYHSSLPSNRMQYVGYAVKTAVRRGVYDGKRLDGFVEPYYCVHYHEQQ